MLFGCGFVPSYCFVCYFYLFCVCFDVGYYLITVCLLFILSLLD